MFFGPVTPVCREIGGAIRTIGSALFRLFYLALGDEHNSNK
jgi:hypothetical protein